MLYIKINSDINYGLGSVCLWCHYYGKHIPRNKLKCNSSGIVPIIRQPLIDVS